MFDFVMNEKVRRCLCYNVSVSWFGDFTEAEFSRAGNKATQTVYAVSGSVPAFSHDMEPQLRKLGLPTCLQKGLFCTRCRC